MLTLTLDYSPGDPFSIGATTVTYTATDASGLTTTCSFAVTVVGKNNLRIKVTRVLELKVKLSLVDHSIPEYVLIYVFISFICANYDVKSMLVIQVKAAYVV